MTKKAFGVLIGRFSGFHNGHLALILEALEHVNKLIVVVGSSNSSRNIKNPFTFVERKKMIIMALLEREEYGHLAQRVTVVEARDFLYDEIAWLNEVRVQVAKITGNSTDVTLFGHDKDASSYYLRNFEEWKPHLQGLKAGGISATDIRIAFYMGEDISSFDVPFYVKSFLQEFRESPEGQKLTEEYHYIKEYRKQQEVYPFPIIFVTVDAVVVKSAHVLVVERGQTPGKGLYALPGGFIGEHESVYESTVRELREETSLSLISSILDGYYRKTEVFDHPMRSERGRTITHASLFVLPSGHLNPVKGGDDAARAFWIPLSDVYAYPERFYEDHAHIIHKMTTGGII